MKMQLYTTVNNLGKQEILGFLQQNHKLGNKLSPENINAWALDAENQLSIGNPASIEIVSWDSIYGYTQTYTISDEGLNQTELEIEED
jgi:hypothetical protein